MQTKPFISKKKADENGLIGLLLNAVTPRQGIAEQPKLGRLKGEHRKKQSQKAKHCHRRPRPSTRGIAPPEEAPLVKVDRRRRDEKDRDVEPIGGFADNAVVGIEDHGNEQEPKQDPTQLDAREILAVAEERALHRRKQQHRPEKELHMLKGRFVHAGKRSDPQGAPQPIVQKMQKRAKERRRRKPPKLPYPYRSFHTHTPVFPYGQSMLPLDEICTAAP